MQSSSLLHEFPRPLSWYQRRIITTMPPDDATPSDCHINISPKQREDGLASWRRHGLEPPTDLCMDWISCKKPPLHWEPLYSRDPVPARLARMTAALDAGADPDELDHELDVRRCLGRPLHCCVGGRGAWGPPRIVRSNLPLVELLLSRGADPRLPGPGPGTPRPMGASSRLPSALEMVRREVEDNATPDDGERELRECGFYAEALRVLKSAADLLDGELPASTWTRVLLVSVAFDRKMDALTILTTCC